MRRNNLGCTALFSLLLWGKLCDAQTTGYIEGINFYSFSSSTGALINTFPEVGDGYGLAVAADDVTIYTPTAIFNSLDVVSGTTGKITASVPVPLPADGVVLTKDGSTAYVWAVGQDSPTERVAAVNTSTLTAGATLSAGGYVDDVAISPDDTTLYVSVQCGGTNCKSPKDNCPIGKGICAFDRNTLALKWTVANVNGLMSLSLDGTSLYVANQGVSGDGSVYVVNTATQAVRRFPLLDGQISRVAIDPVSHYGVLVDDASQSPQNTETAFILNTSTNQLVGKLFSNAPGYGIVVSPGGGPVFAPDGKSIWMLLTCRDQAPQCTLPPGVTLAGVSFPSGALISETPVDEYASFLAFPR